MTVRRLTKAAAIKTAQRYIASGHTYALDFCANYGQIFDNVRQTRWLLDNMVEELIADNNTAMKVKQ